MNVADSLAGGLHLRERLVEAVNYVIEGKAGETKLDRLLRANSQCSLASVYCAGRTRGGHELLQSAWWTGVRFAVTGGVVSLALGPLGPPVAGALATASTVVYPVAVLGHSYNMSLGCFLRLPPLLPVCLADDLFEVVNATLAPSFPWPRGLLLDDGEPVTCAADDVGMKDGLRVAAYWLESAAPGWQAYAPLFTLSALAGARTVDSYAFYYVDKPLSEPRYAACAKFSIPLVLIAALVLAPLLLVALYAVQVVLVLYIRMLRLGDTLADLAAWASSAATPAPAKEDDSEDD